MTAAVRIPFQKNMLLHPCKESSDWTETFSSKPLTRRLNGDIQTSRSYLYVNKGTAWVSILVFFSSPPCNLILTVVG